MKQERKNIFSTHLTEQQKAARSIFKELPSPTALAALRQAFAQPETPVYHTMPDLSRGFFAILVMFFTSELKPRINPR